MTWPTSRSDDSDGTSNVLTCTNASYAVGVIEKVAWTADRAYRVYLFADQTAWITSGSGTTITARLPMYEIGRRLVDLGYDAADLVPE